MHFFDTGLPIGKLSFILIIIAVIVGIKSFIDSRKKGHSIMHSIADIPVAGSSIIDSLDKAGDLAIGVADMVDDLTNKKPLEAQALDLLDCVEERAPGFRNVGKVFTLTQIIRHLDREVDRQKARKMAEDLAILYDPKIHAEKLVTGFAAETIAQAENIIKGMSD